MEKTQENTQWRKAKNTHNGKTQTVTLANMEMTGKRVGKFENTQWRKAKKYTQWNNAKNTQWKKVKNTHSGKIINTDSCTGYHAETCHKHGLMFSQM